MFSTIKFAAATLALTAAGTAIAAPAEQQRITRDGKTFVYTSTVHDDGRTVIDGRHISGGRFHLVVRDGRVTGHSGGMPVSFRVQDAAGAAGGAASVVTAN